MRIIQLDCDPKPSPADLAEKRGVEITATISIRDTDVGLKIGDQDTRITVGDDTLQVPNALILDPSKSTAESSFAAQSRLFSRFATLVRRETDPATRQPVEQRLRVPAALMPALRGLLQEYRPELAQECRETADLAQIIADKVLVSLHHPRSAIHDSHTDEQSTWAAKCGDVYAYAQLRPTDNKLQFAICQGTEDDFDGRIRDPEFLEWMKTAPLYTVRVNAAHRAKTDTPVEALFSALRAKRKIASTPIDMSLAGMA